MLDAVEGLAALLERENAALAAMDLPGAAVLLTAKRTAIDALTAVEPASVPPPAARRLRDLALENRKLLERAMAAQERVIGIVARAAVPVETSYGARGRVARPVAISTRA